MKNETLKTLEKSVEIYPTIDCNSMTYSQAKALVEEYEQRQWESFEYLPHEVCEAYSILFLNAVDD